MNKERAKEILEITACCAQGVILNPIFAVAVGSTVLIVDAEKDQIREDKNYITVNEEHTRINSKMMKSAYQNKLEMFKQYLDEGASIETLNKLGPNPLMVAVAGDA
ncbi:MAG: hypothetical protein IJX20_00130 [Alphaproteobacteria bacterium]|nr:hypothetical protein [Alphaproteobacteria bacterium]